MRAGTNARWLAEITTVTPEALGLMMLEADPHAWRLDRSTQIAAVSDALAEGTATAENLQRRFPRLMPQEIARELAVPIKTTDDDPMAGSIWRFAEYRPRPPHILLYNRGLALLDRALVGAPARQVLGTAMLPDVFVAHELFHHAEATRSGQPIARRYQPTLFRIGNWHWRTGIAALAEIAAGAFAQSLLNLPCHPKMLDFVAIDAISANASVSASTARMSQHR